MNRLMQPAPPPALAGASNGAPVAMGAAPTADATMGATQQQEPPPNAMGAAPGPSPQGQAPMPSPQEIKDARAHAKVMVADLQKLVETPRGDLTKKKVFDAAADMIAKGAFPTAESKQQLIGELAQLPDDETSLRKALGGFLLAVSGAHQQISQAWPEGGA